MNAKALNTQVAGDHYKKQAIQPAEYIHANKIGFFEGNVIKYVTRWRDKGGIEDLRKARHYIDMLIELELQVPNSTYRTSEHNAKVGGNTNSMHMPEPSQSLASQWRGESPPAVPRAPVYKFIDEESDNG
jgi:hypothetical protein